MMQRVPDWQPTSEADLDQVLIDLVAADADELADYQDRVMNEAYFATARKRLSLARYARLMDYHIHEGNQASTWLAVKVQVDHTLPPKFGVWTGDKWNEPDSIIFASETEQKCFTSLNELRVYELGRDRQRHRSRKHRGRPDERSGRDDARPAPMPFAMSSCSRTCTIC